MPLGVRISEPALLEELMSVLLRSGCVTKRVSGDACLVVHVEASHDAEAQRELNFFVRAWQLAHPGVFAAVTA
jgi:hypothetical protein